MGRRQLAVSPNEQKSCRSNSVVMYQSMLLPAAPSPLLTEVLLTRSEAMSRNGPLCCPGEVAASAGGGFSPTSSTSAWSGMNSDVTHTDHPPKRQEEDAS